MVLVRNQLMNTFEKVINVELLRIFVQNVSKSNLQRLSQLFFVLRPHLSVVTEGPGVGSFAF